MNSAGHYLAALTAAVLGTACEDVLITAPDASTQDPCLLPCPLATAVACGLKPSLTFPRFDAQLGAWTTEYCADGAQPGYSLAAGRCADGKKFLTVGGVVTGSVYYYDASGRFVGLTQDSDVGWPGCSTLPAYWPQSIVCEERVVDRVVCGDVFSVDP
jgi:hypothetical protein